MCPLIGIKLQEKSWTQGMLRYYWLQPNNFKYYGKTTSKNLNLNLHEIEN